MNTDTTFHPTLAGTIWPADGAARVLRAPLLVLAGTALLVLAAKVQIPFYPVPMTMQTLVVLLLGTAYGWRLGASTVLFYLALGAIGLPIFAGTPEKGIGIAYMMGGTGGYLLGFVLAAAACGKMAELGWDRRPTTAAAAMLLGNALIYVPGLLWLGSLLGWDKPILEWGLTPFLIGDAMKLALAAVLLPLAWKLVGKARG